MMHSAVMLLMVTVASWQPIEPGLELGTFAAPQKSQYGDSKVRILRIDPQHFELRVLSASHAADGQSKTAREWLYSGGLVAAINPSMFQKDMKTSVSLMKNRHHTNHPRLSGDKMLLAFDPAPGEKLPSVQLVDRECDDFTKLEPQYGSWVQSIRMLSCKGENVWAQQNKTWSIAALGTDTKGRVLFIHARSPYSVHDFVKILQALPIDIARAMYAEGGPEAQLAVMQGKQIHEFVGSFETGFHEDDTNVAAWPIPNVVGIVRK